MKIRTAILMLFLTPALCLAADPFRKMARDISRPLVKYKNPRVGLLAFPYHDGKLSSGSSIICERLTTQLASTKGLRVIERRLVQKILEEQRLNEAGIIDPSTAQKIGQVLGLDVIVTGTLIDLDNQQTEVNVRALKSDSGEIIGASHGVVDRTWEDRPHMAGRPTVVESEPEEPEPAVVTNEPIRMGYPGARGGRGRR